METMLLKDTSEIQITLNKGLLDKHFSVTVINKRIRKQRTYKDKKIMLNLISECIKESD